MKAHIIVILACICAAYAVSDDDTRKMAASMATWFGLTVEQTENCLDKFNATKADYDLLKSSMDYPTYTLDTDEQIIQRRAICSLVCIGHEKGLMTGARINTVKVHDAIDNYDLPANVKPFLQTTTNHCVKEDNVKDATDECDAALNFMKCLFKALEVRRKQL